MNNLTLQRNVQFLYEEQLARVEMAALGCAHCERDPDNPWEIRAHVNGTTANVVNRAAYVGALDDSQTIYQQLILPKYQGGQFNRTRSVNQYLTHWIYPYRGKFHPQMVRALLNIVGAKRGSRVLDPYLGSGTTALEASLLGVDCVGIDLSPLCVLLARVKTQSHKVIREIRLAVTDLLGRSDLDPADQTTAEHEHPAVADFIQVARMVTFSDMARRKREGGPYFRKNLQAMLQSVQAHVNAIAQFKITPGNVSASIGDARSMRSVKTNSIDAVVTSPPYSIALDYVKNDEHALMALNVDTAQLRDQMTGVRGRGPKMRLELYNEDMKQMFHEVVRVLKPGTQAAFVIGDATVDGLEYTTTGEMSGWAEAAGLRRVRQLKKIVYGLYSTMQQEMILIFQKPQEADS